MAEPVEGGGRWIEGRFFFVCGGTLRVIACIDTPEVIDKFLTHLAARKARCNDRPRTPPLHAPQAQRQPPHHCPHRERARSCASPPALLGPHRLSAVRS